MWECENVRCGWPLKGAQGRTGLCVFALARLRVVQGSSLTDLRSCTAVPFFLPAPSISAFFAFSLPHQLRAFSMELQAGLLPSRSNPLSRGLFPGRSRERADIRRRAKVVKEFHELNASKATPKRAAGWPRLVAGGRKLRRKKWRHAAKLRV